MISNQEFYKEPSYRQNVSTASEHFQTCKILKNIPLMHPFLVRICPNKTRKQDNKEKDLRLRLRKEKLQQRESEGNSQNGSRDLWKTAVPQAHGPQVCSSSE